MRVASLNPPVVASEDFSHRGADFVPQKSGCYALTNASGDILYLGKAENLKRRMGDHLDDTEKTGMTPLGVASVFHYALCERGQLPSLETGWMNQFKMSENGKRPPLNKADPPV